MERKTITAQITSQEFKDRFREKIVEDNPPNVLKFHGKNVFYGKMNDDDFYFFYYNAYDMSSFAAINQMIVSTVLYGTIRECVDGTVIDYYIGKRKDMRNFLVGIACFMGVWAAGFLLSEKQVTVGLGLIFVWTCMFLFMIKPKSEIVRCEKMLKQLLKGEEKYG